MKKQYNEYLDNDNTRGVFGREKVKEKLTEIPSEFIEPYLADFMGRMVEFVASARTKEEIEKLHGIGWTVEEVKNWVKGVEMFASEYCGIHARIAMSNECDRFTRIESTELKGICDKVSNEYYQTAY